MKKLLLITTLLTLGGLSVRAQTTTDTIPKDPGHPRVNEVNGRENNQENRIAQGVKSGELTPGEDKRLQKGEARIQNQEAHDRATDGGHITKGEQHQLNHEENRESRRIYRDKHNGKEKKK